MESHTPPPAHLAPIPHSSLRVNFQSFFSFWIACDTPSIEVDTTEQQVARHNQSNIYICIYARQFDNKVLRSTIFEDIFVVIYPQNTAVIPELNLASHGLAVAPRPYHTAVLLWYVPSNILPISSRHDKNSLESSILLTTNNTRHIYT